MKTFLLGLLVLVSTSARAETYVRAIDVTSSYPSGYVGAIDSIHDEADGMRVIRFQYADNQGSNLVFTPEQLRKGVVLLNAFGKDVLTLVAPGFDEMTGGPMIVRFLRRFFQNDRREARFEYAHPQDWVIQTNDQQGRDPFDAIAVRVAMTFGTPQGVDEITMKRGATLVRHHDAADLPRAGSRRRRR